MAKKQDLTLSRDRELGTVTKKMSSGMFETSKGEKVPPLPGIAVGTKVRLTKSRIEIVDGEKEEVVSTEDAVKYNLAAENADLKKRVAALEKAQGKKGSAVKLGQARQTAQDVVSDAGDGTPKNTPPKVES